MPSRWAKQAAGTYVPDPLPKSLPGVAAWINYEARHGTLRRLIEGFCQEQAEPLDPSMVVVERLFLDCIQFRIPCRCADHESKHTFPVDVRFEMNPQTKKCVRL